MSFRTGTVFIAIAMLLIVAFSQSTAADEPYYAARMVFPLNEQHNHAPGIVECPQGGFLVSWYRGSGERTADDVQVLGARLREGDESYSEPFLMADFPGFPDCNTCMMVDDQQRLWLFWPLVISNDWGSCLTCYRISSDFEGEGPPQWDWQGVIPLVPLDFKEAMLSALEERIKTTKNPTPRAKLFAAFIRKQVEDKLSTRLGWQPRCKPTVLPSGRIVLPLYTDTFSVSLMALSDDGGQTWFASEPLAGFGNIQPAVLRRDDGTLVAYMRENGPLNKIRVCESTDDGVHWGPVGTIDIVNPGSGLDAVRLQNGHWAMVYNDKVNDRNSLAISISDDEGKSWKWTRHLEQQEEGRYHYPALIQARNGNLQCVYTYSVEEGKTMKHASFNEAWVQAGD